MITMNSTDFLNVSLLLQIEEGTTKPVVLPMHNTRLAKIITSNAYEWWFILPPYFIIFALSVLGNFMVIATLAYQKKMRTVCNVYLLNLAISDLLRVFFLPFTPTGQVYRRFLFGATLCKLIPFSQGVSVFVGVWTLVSIAWERYFAIYRPLKSKKWQTKCHAYKMIAIVWLLSILLNSPILFASTLQPMGGNEYECREVWSSLELERTFNLALDGALLLIPFSLMSYAHFRIVHKLQRGMKHEIQHNFNMQQLTRNLRYKANLLPPTTPIPQDASTELCCITCTAKKQIKDLNPKLAPEQSSIRSLPSDLEFRHVVRSTHINKSIADKKKVIKMIFVITLQFFVCWTPLYVINTINLFYPVELYQYIGAKGIMSLQLLAYCSSCSNPLTYCFMNRKFRQAFISLFKNCRIFKARSTGRRGGPREALHLQAASALPCRQQTSHGMAPKLSRQEKAEASSSTESHGHELANLRPPRLSSHYMNNSY